MVFPQNLIRNHSFEEIECPDNPINSFESSPTWYAVGADAYWMHVNCPVDRTATEFVLAIQPNLTPHLGLGYVSLEGVLTANGFHITEGVGIELIKPLRADRAYFFEMAALYYLPEASPDLEGTACNEILTPQLQVRLSNEPISLNLKIFAQY